MTFAASRIRFDGLLTPNLSSTYITKRLHSHPSFSQILASTSIGTCFLNSFSKTLTIPVVVLEEYCSGFSGLFFGHFDPIAGLGIPNEPLCRLTVQKPEVKCFCQLPVFVGYLRLRLPQDNRSSFESPLERIRLAEAVSNILTKWTLHFLTRLARGHQ